MDICNHVREKYKVCPLITCNTALNLLPFAEALTKIYIYRHSKWFIIPNHLIICCTPLMYMCTCKIKNSFFNQNASSTWNTRIHVIFITILIVVGFNMITTFKVGKRIFSKVLGFANGCAVCVWCRGLRIYLMYGHPCWSKFWAIGGRDLMENHFLVFRLLKVFS